MTGRVIINVGDGKGKTTAAMGTVVRALGQGFKVAAFQFMKGSIPTGEVKILEAHGAVVHRLGTGFSWTKESWDEDRQMAAQGWAKAKQAITGGEFDLILLDEINYVIGYGLLDAAEVAEVIKNRPKKLHVILTGRGLAEPLADIADTITEMKPIKHAYEAGIPATKGIEF